jgi:hypothetical protein
MRLGAAPDLSNLKTVGQAIVEEMAFGGRDDLGDSCKPAKGGGVEDAIAIAL